MRIAGRIANQIEELVCAVLLLFMALLGFANVVTRYLTSYSLAFSEELLVNLFVWISLLGAAIAVKRNAHLGVTALTDLFPRSWQRWVLTVTYACAAVLFVVVIKQGWDLALVHRRWGQKTYSTDLPMWWFSAAVPAGGGFVLLRLLQGIHRALTDRSDPEAGGVGGGAAESGGTGAGGSGGDTRVNA